MNKKQTHFFLQQEKLFPVKKMGQNFLINPRIIQKIVDRVQTHPLPFVEIGPGAGALTRHFKKEQVSLVERDKKLARYWKEAGWTVFCADILKFNWAQLPQKFTIFGNLPYEITGPLLIKACRQKERIFTMLFMTQKELADNLLSLPYSKSYGLLSVMSQVFWNVRRVMNVSQTNFYPRPQVDGTVLEFQIKKRKKPLPVDMFLPFLKQCFAFRRKMFFKQLFPGFKEKAKETLKKLDLPESIRAEQIAPEDFVRLYFLTKG